MFNLKEEVEKRLTGDTISKIYSEVLEKSDVDDKGNIQGICPFHEDKHASFGYNIKHLGKYNCFACGTSGNIYTYVKEQKKNEKPLLWLANQLNIEIEKEETKTKNFIDKDLILSAVKNIWENNHDKVEELINFGISEKCLRNHNIGYREGRFWIPIKDSSGDFVNIRKYDPKSKTYKFISHSEKINGKKQTFGEDRLWPISALKYDTIYLMEGEKDTLVARSLEINAMTNTAGAESFKKEWGQLFKGKNVIICMDIDEAGISGSLKRAKIIHPYAAQVKIINLPLNIQTYPKGDFTNYITNEGHSKDNFINIVDESDVFISDKKITDNTEFKVILPEASKAKYINKKCYITNVLCCGKDQAPYAAPKKCTARCFNNKRSVDDCAGCVLLDKNTCEHTIQKDDTILLDLIRDNKQTIMGRIKQVFGIRKKCFKYSIEINDFYNIEKVRIIPDITYNIEEDFEQVYRVGYYVTDDDTKLETNRGYNIHAITCADTKTQYIQHQIYDIENSNTNIDDFELNEDTIKLLKKFQVNPNQTISEKLNEIYLEYSKISQIYGRQDMFMLADLVFNSALSFNFQNKSIGKGWLEGCIMGDSGQGKSEMIKFLTRHYRAGEIISGESASYAGLVGGLSQVGGNWQLQWGRMPLNDKRMCVIEESSGVQIEDIAKLSDIRSTGEARIVKVTTEATRSRNRILWLSNPRKDNLGIKNYTYGVFTIKELFGRPEDVRRVDLAMTVASGEVSEKLMNKDPEEIVPKYDSDTCHARIMFAWSRRSKDIIISKEVEKYVLKKAIEISGIYTANIPLIEPADARNKLIRMTVSLAIMLFSVDENLKVVPTIEHVDAIYNYLREIYDKPRFAYDDYSKKEMAKVNFCNHARVCEILNLDDYASRAQNLDDLMQSSTLNKTIICDCINSSSVKEELKPNDRKYRNMIRFLKRSNAIDEHERFFIIQPGFISFLKGLKKHLEKGKEYHLYMNEDKVLCDGTKLD